MISSLSKMEESDAVMPPEQEKQCFTEIHGSLAETCAGHIAVIHGHDLIGVYPTLEEAYSEAVKKLGLASVLIKKIGEQDEQVSIPSLSLGILSANNPHPAGR